MSTRHFLPLSIAGAFLSITVLTTPANAQVTPFVVTGADAAAIQPTVDSFRTALGGGAVAGPNGSFGGVRREVNWDGVPAGSSDPNPFPVDFFNVNSPRGIVYSTPGTGFLVSAAAGGATTPLFGFQSDFATFSGPKLFTAVNSNITEVLFFVPGTTTSATVNGFGSVFTDVEIANVTNIQFFEQDGTLISQQFASAGPNQGFSFVGITSDIPIFRVRITSGLNTIVSNGVLGNPNDDVVVMDDFIYSEPTAVASAAPEPSSLALLGMLAFGPVAAAKRRRQRGG
jgi:hypothetical protein